MRILLSQLPVYLIIVHLISAYINYGLMALVISKNENEIFPVLKLDLSLKEKQSLDQRYNYFIEAIKCEAPKGLQCN